MDWLEDSSEKIQRYVGVQLPRNLRTVLEKSSWRVVPQYYVLYLREAAPNANGSKQRRRAAAPAVMKINLPKEEIAPASL